MKGFLEAIRFLTIIPINTGKEADLKALSSSTVYFPLIGLLLGIILAGGNSLMSLVPLPRLVISVLLVVALVVLTGGLHLDGLADTFDGLSSRKKKSEMLKVMRDPHIGTFGVLSIACILLIKVSVIASCNPGIINRILILMCLLSRYSLTFLIFLFPYAREEGKGDIFFKGMNLKLFIVSTGISVACTVLLWQLKGLLLMAGILMFVYAAGAHITRKLGGMTGDTLGAVCEFAECFVLLAVLVFGRCD